MNNLPSNRNHLPLHNIFPSLSKQQWIALLLIVSLVLGLLPIWLPYQVLFIALALIIGLYIAFVKPHWILVSMLILRSSADGLQDLITFFPGRWFSFNLAGLMNIIAATLGGLILIRRLLRNDRLFSGFPLNLLLILILVSLLGIPQSIDTNASLKAWVRLFGYYGIAAVSYEIIKQNLISIRSILRGITIASIPPMILGYYQAFSGSGYFFPGYQSTPFAYRPQGTFGHPAILASYLIILICISIACYFYNYPLWPRSLLLLLALSSTGLEILTFARSQWTGAIVAIGVIGLIRSRKLILIGLIISLILILTVPTIRERLQGEQATESFEWRLEVWQASLRLLKEPTLLGNGLDTSHLMINNVLVNVFVPPHNDYLRMALEIGVIGFITYLILQIGLFLFTLRAFLQKNQEVKLLSLILLGIIVGGWVISFLDNYLSYVSVQWYIWAMIGSLSWIQEIHWKGQKDVDVQISF